MEFLVLWLVTCVASFGMEFANGLRMFKDLADAGYKVDEKRFLELGKQLNPNETKAILLIPVFNLIQVFQKTILYNKVRPIILDQLSVMDVLKEMSEIEKTEYLKNPTGLNALVVSLKTEIRLSKAKKIEINDGNEHGEIFYEIGKSFADITILKVTGSVSRLNAEEQKKKIIEELDKIYQEEKELDCTFETVVENSEKEGKHLEFEICLEREERYEKEVACISDVNTKNESGKAMEISYPTCTECHDKVEIKDEVELAQENINNSDEKANLKALKESLNKYQSELTLKAKSLVLSIKN